MTEYVVIEMKPSGNLEQVGEFATGPDPIPGDLLVMEDGDGSPTYFEVITRAYKFSDSEDVGQLVVVRLESHEGRSDHYQRRLTALGG